MRREIVVLKRIIDNQVIGFRNTGKKICPPGATNRNSIIYGIVWRSFILSYKFCAISIFFQICTHARFLGCLILSIANFDREAKIGAQMGDMFQK